MQQIPTIIAAQQSFQPKQASKLKLADTFKNLVLSLTLLTITHSASADNTLHLGDGVNLIAVNGKELNSESFFGDSSQYRLPNGINQILVNYTAEIKKGSDYELESSNASVILFKIKDAIIHLQAPEIKRLKDLSTFEEGQNWILRDGVGKPLPFKSNLIKRSGFQLSRDYEQELEDFNKTNSQAALPQKNIFSNSQINTQITNHVKNNKNISKENIAAQMLIYWYNQADERTRESFKEIINKQ